MRIARWIAAPLCAAVLSGCGINQPCEEEEPYRTATEGPRIVAPEGLDDLEPSRETRIPEANPQAEDPAVTCLELPPAYQGRGS